MIALVVFTDGRGHLLEHTLASAAEHLQGPITETFLVVDGEGDDDGFAHAYRMVETAFPDAQHGVLRHGRRLGFGGSIKAAWRDLANESEFSDARLVFHLEDDFTFNRDVDVSAMAWVLDHRPNLVQLALRRQPWNDEERSAGGIVECHPEAYEEHDAGAISNAEYAIPLSQIEWSPLQWLEHRLFFTTNPSLYRRDLCALGWPGDERFSEGKFTHRLLEDPEVRFGFWGARDSGEWCHHIGEHRVGTGY